MSSPIYYSPGPIIDQILIGGDPGGLISQIASVLVSCGWTVTRTTSEANGVTGYEILSLVNESSIQVKVYFRFFGAGSPFSSYYITIYFSDSNGLLFGSFNNLNVGGGDDGPQSFRIIASPWYFYIFNDINQPFSNYKIMGGCLSGTSAGCLFSWWALGGRPQDNGTSTFRNTLVPDSHATYSFAFKDATTTTYGYDGINNIIRPQLLVQRQSVLAPQLKFYDQNYPIITPFLVAGQNNTPQILGYLPDAFISSGTYPIGAKTSVDGHSWEVLSYNYYLGSLWIVTGIASAHVGFSH